MSQVIYRRPPPPNEEAAQAKETLKQIGQFDQQSQPVLLQVGTAAEPHSAVEIPSDLLPLIQSVLVAISEGQGLMILPEDAEVTTKQAADILNVSRPYVIKLIEEKQLPFHMVGSHRRIPLEALLAYKKRVRAEQDRLMDQLVADWDNDF